jgi:flagellar biosynthesis protein FlhF
LLRRSGLSELALGRLQSAPEWEQWQAGPLHRALVGAGRHLRREAERPDSPAPLTRAAFLGAPGVGRTTALCKWLGAEVFRRGRLGHVVTVEFDRPNPPGPLPVFCEALGVPVAHFPAATRPAVAGGFVYFDLPGVSTRDPAENAALANFLDREEIEQRVLVLNAAYDHAALRAAYAAGRALGATHLVFTHLDETPQWGRLWDYLVDGALEPLFFGTGPSLTGDCEEDVFGALVRRTLAPAPAAPEADPDETEEEDEALAASGRR